MWDWIIGPLTLTLIAFLALLGLVAGVLLSHRRKGGEMVWVDEEKPVPLGTGGPELINFTDLRSITKHQMDTEYNPRGDADEQDSVALDARKEERIRSVVNDTQTRTKPSKAKESAPPTHATLWPTSEQKQQAEVDEKRKTRLRALLRNTQSSS